MTFSGLHTRGPSATSFPRLLMKEDEGPTAALGRVRGRIAVVFGEGGHVRFLPTPSLRLKTTQQLPHNLVTHP